MEKYIAETWRGDCREAINYSLNSRKNASHHSPVLQLDLIAAFLVLFRSPLDNLFVLSWSVVHGLSPWFPAATLHSPPSPLLRLSAIDAPSAQWHLCAISRRFGAMPAVLVQNMTSLPNTQAPIMENPTADKKRNKLGYHRTSVACGEWMSYILLPVKHTRSLLFSPADQVLMLWRNSTLPTAEDSMSSGSR